MDYWEEIRKSILNRDDYSCVKCGSKENLHVHHLIPRYAGGNDEPNNLITLCAGCHATYHLSLQTTLARKFIERWAIKVAHWVDYDRKLPKENYNLGSILRLFGLERFRAGQLEVILAVLKNESLLYISPTGSGKALCFQLPCMLRKGYYMIFSPLKALMRDQVGKLHDKQIPATFINSDLSVIEKNNRMAMLENGYFKFLYVTPERFGDKVKLEEVERLKKIKPTAIVIDEAHVIPKWEKAFRPDYGKLGTLRKELGCPQLLAFTATAGLETQKRIIGQLGFTYETMKIFLNDLDRPNIILVKKDLYSYAKRIAYINSMSQKLPEGKIMIFVPTLNVGEKVYDAFLKSGELIPFYHSQLDTLERENLFNRYLGIFKPELNKIICTNAFGMGLDIPNIRLVVHWQHPASIEDYVQEYGRAGRDGKTSIAILFFDSINKDRDFNLQDFMIKKTIEKSSLNELEKKEEYDFHKRKLKQISDYSHSSKCLRKQILLYFQGTIDKKKKPVVIRFLEFIFSSRQKVVRNRYCCSNCTNIDRIRKIKL